MFPWLVGVLSVCREEKHDHFNLTISHCRNIASIEERRVINEADVDEIPEKHPVVDSVKILPVCKADLLSLQVSVDTSQEFEDIYI